MVGEVMGNPSGTTLRIRATPRAKKSEISEILEDGTIKVRLTAPPVEGKANKALVEFLSQILGISSAQIKIISGKTGRNKLVRIDGIDGETARTRIVSQIS